MEGTLQALQARRGGKGRGTGSTSVVEASEAGDASRTPEDSVCSNEGPSHYTEGDTQAWCETPAGGSYSDVYVWGWSSGVNLFLFFIEQISRFDGSIILS